MRYVVILVSLEFEGILGSDFRSFMWRYNIGFLI